MIFNCILINLDFQKLAKIFIVIKLANLGFTNELAPSAEELQISGLPLD